MSEQIVNLIAGLCGVFFIVIPLLTGLLVCLIIWGDHTDKTNRARDLFRRTLSDEENRIITEYLSVNYQDYERLKDYGEVEATK